MLESRIHNAILDRLKKAVFYRVTNSPTDGTRSVDTLAKLTPSIVVNRALSQFRDAKLNKQAFQRERAQWVWAAEVSFNEEASLQSAEDDLAHNPIFLGADPSKGERQTIVTLMRVEYTDPVKQQAEGGTRAVFVFEAAPLPL